MYRINLSGMKVKLSDAQICTEPIYTHNVKTFYTQ